MAASPKSNLLPEENGGEKKKFITITHKYYVALELVSISFQDLPLQNLLSSSLEISLFLSFTSNPKTKMKTRK